MIDFKSEFAKFVMNKAIMCMRSMHRPFYLGEIALETGMSFKRTECMIDYLIANNNVRAATKQEIQQIDAPDGEFVFVYSGGAEEWLTD